LTLLVFPDHYHSLIRIFCLFFTPSKRILCLETFIFLSKISYNCFTFHFQLAKLTNNYYHCIPQRDYVYEKIEPICNKEKYKKELRYLSNLLDIECAEKIVIGAQSKLSSKSLSRFYNSDWHDAIDSKSKYVLTQNHDNVSEWSNMFYL
jgi:hypothetical protein